MLFCHIVVSLLWLYVFSIDCMGHLTCWYCLLSAILLLSITCLSFYLFMKACLIGNYRILMRESGYPADSGCLLRYELSMLACFLWFTTCLCQFYYIIHSSLFLVAIGGELSDIAMRSGWLMIMRDRYYICDSRWDRRFPPVGVPQGTICLHIYSSITKPLCHSKSTAPFSRIYVGNKWGISIN